jgi:hypothetical protein
MICFFFLCFIRFGYTRIYDHVIICLVFNFLSVYGFVVLAETNSGKSVRAFVRGWLPKPSNNEHIFEYAADFTVPFDFGNPGAILVSNLHGKEVYLMEIVVHGFDEGPIFFPANTWIHSCKDNPDDRIIFRNQVSVVYQGFFSLY